jgi:hypothetical protein
MDRIQMANELANATVLMGDGDFRNWMRAAMVYQSRLVILEDPGTANHANRLWLANITVVYPERFLNIFVNAIACDPTVAGLGTVVGTDITQETMLTKVSEVWNPIANLMYAEQGQ